MVLHSITKTVSIDAPVQRVYAFVSNPGNWPKWAISSVVTIKPAGEWWAVETRTGLGRLRMKANEACGILDYDLLGSVPVHAAARVVPNGEGSELILTYFKAANLPEEVFHKQIAPVDQDLAKLKELMEAR